MLRIINKVSWLMIIGSAAAMAVSAQSWATFELVLIFAIIGICATLTGIATQVALMIRMKK